MDHRRVFMFDRAMKGWSAHNALVTAWVVHPFDSDARPSRQLEKGVRKESRAFARRCRNADQYTCSQDALRTLQWYVEAAESTGDVVYVRAWRDVLDTFYRSENEDGLSGHLNGEQGYVEEFLDDAEDEYADNNSLIDEVDDEIDCEDFEEDIEDEDDEEVDGSEGEFLAERELTIDRVNALSSYGVVSDEWINYFAAEVITVTTMNKVDRMIRVAAVGNDDLRIVLDQFCYFVMKSAYLLGLESLNASPSLIRDPAEDGDSAVSLVRTYALSEDFTGWIFAFSETAQAAGVRTCSVAEQLTIELAALEPSVFAEIRGLYMDSYGSGLRLAYICVQMERDDT